jgi:hypothetical protein
MQASDDRLIRALSSLHKHNSMAEAEQNLYTERLTTPLALSSLHKHNSSMQQQQAPAHTLLAAAGALFSADYPVYLLY